jgi:hypothetical protein
MQKQMTEMFEKSTEIVMDSARKISELNQRTFDTLFQQQSELATFFMDASARSLELMTKAKGYQDLMAGQTALMRECSERGIAAVRSNMTFATESSNQYSDLAKEGVKVAQEQMAAAASNMQVKA